jgi:hypothetical protein
MAAASKAIDAAFSEKPVLKASIYEAIRNPAFALTNSSNGRH